MPNSIRDARIPALRHEHELPRVCGSSSVDASLVGHQSRGFIVNLQQPVSINPATFAARQSQRSWRGRELKRRQFCSLGSFSASLQNGLYSGSVVALGKGVLQRELRLPAEALWTSCSVESARVHNKGTLASWVIESWIGEFKSGGGTSSFVDSSPNHHHHLNSGRWSRLSVALVIIIIIKRLRVFVGNFNPILLLHSMDKSGDSRFYDSSIITFYDSCIDCRSIDSRRRLPHLPQRSDRFIEYIISNGLIVRL